MLAYCLIFVRRYRMHGSRGVAIDTGSLRTGCRTTKTRGPGRGFFRGQWPEPAARSGLDGCRRPETTKPPLLGSRWGISDAILHASVLRPVTITAVGPGCRGTPSPTTRPRPRRRPGRNSGRRLQEKTEAGTRQASRGREESRGGQESGGGESAGSEARGGGDKAGRTSQANGDRNGKDAATVAKLIDDGIDRALAENKIAASPTATDAEFLRRVYLDLTGVIPTAAKAKAFLDDKSAGQAGEAHRRAARQPGLRPAPGRRLDGPARPADDRQPPGELRPAAHLAGRRSSTQNTGWDTDRADLVTAAGEQEKNPAVTFFLSNNTVDKMTDEVCKLFLGVQLQCAQCHNHPFTTWKQDEYWAMAQFFMKVQVGGLGKDQTPGDQRAERRPAEQVQHAARVGQDGAGEVPAGRAADADARPSRTGRCWRSG